MQVGYKNVAFLTDKSLYLANDTNNSKTVQDTTVVTMADQ